MDLHRGFLIHYDSCYNNENCGSLLKLAFKCITIVQEYWEEHNHLSKASFIEDYLKKTQFIVFTGKGCRMWSSQLGPQSTYDDIDITTMKNWRITTMKNWTIGGDSTLCDDFKNLGISDEGKVNVKQQTDSYSCPVFISMYAFNIINNISLLDSPSDNNYSDLCSFRNYMMVRCITETKGIEVTTVPCSETNVNNGALPTHNSITEQYMEEEYNDSEVDRFPTNQYNEFSPQVQNENFYTPLSDQISDDETQLGGDQRPFSLHPHSGTNSLGLIRNKGNENNDDRIRRNSMSQLTLDDSQLRQHEKLYRKKQLSKPKNTNKNKKKKV